MVQYRFTCLVWFRKIITWHLHAFIYFCLIILECEFGAIILCVDFGASGDCDCEDCCYSRNYQGKWCFMFLSQYFDYALEICCIGLALIILLSIYMLCLGNPSSGRIVRISSKLRYLPFP